MVGRYLEARSAACERVPALYFMVKVGAVPYTSDKSE